MNVYEVWLPVGNELWLQPGSNPLLEVTRGKLLSGHHYEVIHPKDELARWLLEFTPSWAYYHEWSVRRFSMDPVSPTSLVFGFHQASDAVLFKLTWGGI